MSTRSGAWQRAWSTCPLCGNAHIAQPAVGDCLVLEEIDDGC
jgi:hypothetical protein